MRHVETTNTLSLVFFFSTLRLSSWFIYASCTVISMNISECVILCVFVLFSGYIFLSSICIDLAPPPAASHSKYGTSRIKLEVFPYARTACVLVACLHRTHAHHVTHRACRQLPLCPALFCVSSAAWPLIAVVIDTPRFSNVELLLSTASTQLSCDECRSWRGRL